MQHRAEGTIRRIVNGNVFIELFARSVSQASDLKSWQQTILSDNQWAALQTGYKNTDRLPVNGNIKHGAHSLDARQRLTESVFGRYFYETQ
jgi:hypothetical protein